MGETPLLEIVSHINGKNAKVRVYRDRVEWERGKTVSGAKLAAGVMTAGLSLAATGVRSRKHAGVEMIPMRSISSVTQHRDTPLNDTVTIVTSGNTIAMRCSKAEADRLRAAILASINGEIPTQSSPMPPPPSAPAPAVAAGWYPVPGGSRLRWWDGSRWTEHYH